MKLSVLAIGVRRAGITINCVVGEFSRCANRNHSRWLCINIQRRII
jgi:hypothetical protein